MMVEGRGRARARDSILYGLASTISWDFLFGGGGGGRMPVIAHTHFVLLCVLLWG